MRKKIILIGSLLLAMGDSGVMATESSFLKTSPASNFVKQNSKTITGVISDERGDPLIGATVLVKGGTVGCITDVDGNYSIEVSDPSAILVVSFLGYQTQEIKTNNRSTINVQLKEDLQQLEQVVVVGYASQKKVNVIGAVASADFENDAMASRPLTNASAALSGLLPGLSVTQPVGVPGSDGASLKIRGTGSLNASQNPLVIIDGQPGDINSISPNDIANISVLKDAASAAIYGSRASNGVVLVTTKTGSNSQGKVTFSYNGNIGFSKPTNLFHMISNSADHLTVLRQIDLNSGNYNTIATPELIEEWRENSKTDPIRYPNTDWWDWMIKDNTIQNHSISARGGNDKISFYTSLNYLNNDGLLPNTGYVRTTFRNTLSYQVTPWLKLGNTITAMFGDQDPGAAGSAGVFKYLLATTPTVLPKHPDGRYGGGNADRGNNQFRVLENTVGEHKTQRYTGKLSVTLTPIKGLEIAGSYFIDMYNYDAWTSLRQQEHYDFKTGEIVLRKFPAVLEITNSYTKRRRSVLDLYATYTKTLGDHDFSVLAGYNQEYYKDRNFTAKKKGLLSLDVPVFDAAPTVHSAGGNTVEAAMRSYFGRIGYSFQQKYLFEANIRVDGSSRFAPDERWGVFPSVSLGWRMSEERFWNKIRDYVESFKVRASWGQLGNNGVGYYDWQDVYGTANYSFGGTTVQGLAPSAIANPLMTWETTDVLNFGFDIAFLKNFNLSLDFYDKLTHGILANIPIPFVNGGLTPPRMNSAEVRNRGVELALGYQKQIGDVHLSVGVNGSYNDNKIEKYKGDFLEPHSVGVWTEGQTIGKFYLRQIDHIVQDKAEIDRMLAEGYTFHPSVPGPGDFLYKDVNKDKKINDDDRVLMGDPLPRLNYSANVGVQYKGFDFYTLLSGVAGVDKYISALFNHNTHTIGYLYPERFLHQWTEENPSTTVPKVYTGNPKNSMASDYNLYDASFLRVKTIQLGYSLPKHWIKTLHLDKVRLYVNLENFFTFTSYPGMDPEMASTGFDYPLLKTVSFGLNVNF